MPPLTVEKAFLIAIIIGLGAAIVAKLPAKSVPTFQRSAINSQTSKAIGNFWKKGPAESETGHQFIEQTPVLYGAINAPFTMPQG